MLEEVCHKRWALWFQHHELYQACSLCLVFVLQDYMSPASCPCCCAFTQPPWTLPWNHQLNKLFLLEMTLAMIFYHSNRNLNYYNHNRGVNKHSNIKLHSLFLSLSLSLSFSLSLSCTHTRTSF